MKLNFFLKLLIALTSKSICRAREALRQCLPDQLKDSTFSKCLKDDKSTKHWLAQLLKNVETSPPTSAQSNGPDLSAPN